MKVALCVSFLQHHQESANNKKEKKGAEAMTDEMCVQFRQF
jgi:hypothetical protein